MLPSTLRLILYTHRLPTTFIKGWKRHQAPSFVSAKSLNFLAHRTIPSLIIPVNISKSNWFMSRRRCYPIDGSSSGGGSCCWQCCLWLPRTEDQWRCQIAGRGGEEPVPVSCWRGYEERSTQSCRLARDSVEGLVDTADPGEPAAKLVCSTRADLEAWTSGDGEPILA